MNTRLIKQLVPADVVRFTVGEFSGDR